MNIITLASFEEIKEILVKDFNLKIKLNPFSEVPRFSYSTFDTFYKSKKNYENVARFSAHRNIF